MSKIDEPDVSASSRPTLMGGLRIPPGYRGSLELLATLAGDGLDVAAALRDLPEMPGLDDIALALKDGVPAGDLGDEYALAEALISLAVQRQAWEPTELGRLIGESDSLDIEDAEERNALSRQVEAIVDLPAIVRAGRALNVMSEQQNMLARSRILSDVRPVFDADATELPHGAVVLHSLVLDYRAGQTDAVVAMALDRTDLIALQEQVQRALEKDATLRRWLTGSGLGPFDVERKGDQ